jgi:hypothetical protein
VLIVVAGLGPLIILWGLFFWVSFVVVSCFKVRQAATWCHGGRSRLTVDCVASMHAHSAWPMLANPTVSSGAAAQQCCFCHCIGPRRVGFLGCASACLRCARCAVLLLHVVAERGRARADGARRAAAARAGERDPLGPAASIPLGTVATWLAGRARSVARWSRIAEYQYAALTL